MDSGAPGTTARSLPRRFVVGQQQLSISNASAVTADQRPPPALDLAPERVDDRQHGAIGRQTPVAQRLELARLEAAVVSVDVGVSSSAVVSAAVGGSLLRRGVGIVAGGRRVRAGFEALDVVAEVLAPAAGEVVAADPEPAEPEAGTPVRRECSVGGRVGQDGADLRDRLAGDPDGVGLRVDAVDQPVARRSTANRRPADRVHGGSVDPVPTLEVDGERWPNLGADALGVAVAVLSVVVGNGMTVQR